MNDKKYMMLKPQEKPEWELRVLEKNEKNVTNVTEDIESVTDKREWIAFSHKELQQ